MEFLMLDFHIPHLCRGLKGFNGTFVLLQQEHFISISIYVFERLLSVYHSQQVWHLYEFPVQVEALKGYRVLDVACGSGDAQTLCITDNDCVWSWGDGDYGKLGLLSSHFCSLGMGPVPLELGIFESQIALNWEFLRCEIRLNSV